MNAKYIGILILFLSCQSTPPEEVPWQAPRFSLEEQGQLEVPFDETWTIYLPEGLEAIEDQDLIAALEKERPKNFELLFFAVKPQLQAQTQYLRNSKATLDAFVKYLKGIAYKNVAKARDLGPFETESGIQGQFLQYQIGEELYFELIYQIEDFFLRTIISTPLANYQNLAEFTSAKNYIVGIFKGIQNHTAGTQAAIPHE